MDAQLPVNEILPELIAALESKGITLLEAAPGAGKSTLVPPALLRAGLAGDKKIYLLEPRRLAARSLAGFISRLLGSSVGDLCGYRVHRDSRVSANTRIEVITEGVMLRLLQEDPALEDGAVVIFDEFHERNLLSDLTMSLLLEIKETLREDIILLFMSATPDCESLASLIPELSIIRSEGRQYPVDLHYHSLNREPGPPSTYCGNPPLSLFQEIVKKSGGDLLVFLPGEGEIRRWHKILSGQSWPEPVEVLTLYGSMSLANQNRVVSSKRDLNSRRIILSTDIAETSLTIPGITTVIDSGLTRRPRYRPSSGLTLLHTEFISKASAKQRAGRAGRTAPGACYRLWSKQVQASLETVTPPEILQADLTPLVLELAKWGCTDPSGRKWLSPPPPAAWDSAVELLRLLGALDHQGRITGQGEAMASLPVHPRMASLLLYGQENQYPGEASLLAAFLEQRDFLPSDKGADLLLRLDYLTRSDAGSYRSDLKRIKEEAANLHHRLAGQSMKGSMEFSALANEAPAMMAQAFPDRIGLQVEPGVYQLSGGGRVILDPSDPLAVFPCIIAAHCGGDPGRQKLFLGISIDQKEIEKLFSQQIEEEVHGRWDKQSSRIFSETRRRLGKITLGKRANSRPSSGEITAIIKDALRKEGRSILPWTKESNRLFERMLFAREQARRSDSPWPDLTDQGLADSVDVWLIPFLQDGKLNFPLTEPLKTLMNWTHQQYMNEVAPDFYLTVLGNRRKIQYGDGEPYLPVPLQEMYGCDDSPRLGDRALVLHLQNPAGRTVQITADLKGFWETGWSAVRSELKGRYPKHYWPENPANAEASLKTGKNRPT